MTPTTPNQPSDALLLEVGNAMAGCLQKISGGMFVVTQMDRHIAAELARRWSAALRRQQEATTSVLPEKWRAKEAAEDWFDANVVGGKRLRGEFAISQAAFIDGYNRRQQEQGVPDDVRKDAERYRWLRLRAGLDIHMDRFGRFTLPSGDAIAPPPIPFRFDAAVDEAIAASPTPPIGAITMDNDKRRGLYKKYIVSRVDGSSAPGGKHEDCDYFVLDLSHDRFAIDALKAYARACGGEYPELAQDLFARASHSTKRAKDESAEG